MHTDRRRARSSTPIVTPVFPLRLSTPFRLTCVCGCVRWSAIAIHIKAHPYDGVCPYSTPCSRSARLVSLVINIRCGRESFGRNPTLRSGTRHRLIGSCSIRRTYVARAVVCIRSPRIGWHRRAYIVPGVIMPVVVCFDYSTSRRSTSWRFTHRVLCRKKSRCRHMLSLRACIADLNRMIVDTASMTLYEWH